MTQTTPQGRGDYEGTGEYGPNVAGPAAVPGRGTAAAYAADPRELPGLKIGAHATEMALSIAAVVLAALGAVLIAWPGAHVVGGWVSLAGILVGLYAQLTSDTTYERMVNVCAIGLAAVAFAMHLHHGGLW